MRTLGTWTRLGSIVLLMAVGAAGPALAQERGTPWLGVVTQSLDDDLRDGLDFRGEGVVVTRVIDGSPADRAGIERRDILVNVNDRRIESPDQLTRLIRGMRVGQMVSIEIERGGRKRSLNVRLGTRSDSEGPERQGREWKDMERDMDDLHRDMDDFHRHMDRPDGDLMIRTMGRGRLGVRVENVEGDSDERGARIVEVVEGTPAERGGLKSGDVIVRVGDREVEDTEDLVRALGDTPKGNTEVTVLRRGSRRTVEVELDEGPRMRMFRGAPGRGNLWERRAPAPAPPGAQRDLTRENEELREEIRQLREQIRDLEEKLRKQEDDEDR